MRTDDKDALSAFVGLLHGFIKRPDGKQNEFLRLKDTAPSTDDSLADLILSDAAAHGASSIEPFDVEDTTIAKHWNNGAIDAHLAKQIGRIAGCNIEQKLDTIGMLVKGANAHDVDSAIAKLDIVWASTVSVMSFSQYLVMGLTSEQQQQATFPIVHNFQICEGEINIFLQIVPLRNLRDRLITTLVSPDLVKKLSSQLIVVMMKGAQTYPLERIKDKRSFDIESALWKGNSYRSIGQTQLPSLNRYAPNRELPAVKEPAVKEPAIEEPPVEKRRYRTLSEWVDESSAAVPVAINPFVPLPGEQYQERDQAKNEVPQQIVDTSVASRKRPIKARKAKGALPKDALLTEPTQQDSTDTIAKDKVLDKQLPPSKQFPNIKEQLSTSRPLHTSKATIKPQDTLKSTTNDERNGHHLNATTSYANELWSLQPTNAPNIQPPYMPARSTTSGAPSNANSEAQWAQARVSAATEGNLIDILSPATSSREKQNIEAVNGRRFRNTMNQRKPSPRSVSQNLPNSGEISVLKQYDNVASQLLSLTRSMQGDVKLEVRIGRLLIDYQSGSSEFKKRPFAVGQWHLVFPNRPEGVKLQSFITERLTSLGSDIDFIVQLKLASGRNMFTPEPCERTTFYRFTCTSRLDPKRRVVFDIDEDRKVEIRSAEMLVGALDLHYPKRYWDARIAVTFNETSIEDHHEAIHTTTDKLCVVPAADQSYIELSTEVDDKVLTLRSIELHRETCHRSNNYPDLIMRLSEIQDLNLELTKAGPIQKCHAWTKAKKDMISDGRLWWEVSISSSAASRMLQENQILELGNTSNWKPSDIVDAAIVRNMNHLARDIVTRIDSVGYYNKGPKTSTSTEASEAASQKLGFW